MPTIEEIRISQELTQARLAKLSGIAASTISRLERGMPVEEKTVKVLCEALRVPFEEVTGYNRFVPVVHRRRHRR